MGHIKISDLPQNALLLPAIELPVNNAGTSEKINILQLQSGWWYANETWAYASADAPTFTFTIAGDVTTKYSVGMKIQLTQTTVKYFIITAISYGAPNTTITCYGGTDYTLTSAAISANYYSTQKSPYGFPISPLKWSVELLSTSQRSTGTPTQNTWYNAESLSFPIGIWDTQYFVSAQGNVTTVANFVQTTLSTANNSESDTDMTSMLFFTGTSSLIHRLSMRKILNFATKTTMYLNYRTTTASVTDIDIRGDYVKTIIRAICAYL